MNRAAHSRTDRILDRLVLLPSWVTLSVGVLLYITFEWFQRTHISPHQNPLLTIGTSVYAPLFFGLFLCIAIVGAIHRRKRFSTLEQQTGITSLKAMQWKEFEHLIAEVYERQGFAVSYALDVGPDGGVDVVLRRAGRRWLVQCKCWRTWSVGVATVREMFGILHHEGADDVIVVTTGDFTEDARNFAKGKPIVLINGQELWELVQSVKSAPLADMPDVEPGKSHVPVCPGCGSSMLQRTAKRGVAIGKQFWGCSRYPACNGSRSFL